MRGERLWTAAARWRTTPANRPMEPVSSRTLALCGLATGAIYTLRSYRVLASPILPTASSYTSSSKNPAESPEVDLQRP
jgi:hypothetical protein